MSNFDTVTANTANNSVDSDTNARYWCFMCEREFSRPRAGHAEVYCPDCNCISEQIESNEDPRNFRPYDAQRENLQLRRQTSQRQQRRQQTPAQQEAASAPRLNIFYQNAGIPDQNPASIDSVPQNDLNNLMQARRIIRSQLNQDQAGIPVVQRIRIIPIEGNMLGPLLGGPLNMVFSGMPMNFEDIEGRIIEEFLRNDPNQYGPPPAPEESVNKLKEVCFSEETCKAKDCSVCQEDFKNGENVLIMPCEHTFHKECLKKWLSMHNSCPVCRKPLEDRGVTDA